MQGVNTTENNWIRLYDCIQEQLHTWQRAVVCYFLQGYVIKFCETYISKFFEVYDIVLLMTLFEQWHVFFYTRQKT